MFNEHIACEALGTPLIIELDKNEYKLNEEILIKIEYSTSKNSEVNQWFTKEQTNSKEFPFMYTQCQAILARSLLPCQVKKFFNISLFIRIPLQLKLQYPLN